MSVPRAPKGLGAPGRTLWRSVCAEVELPWQLDARDLALLEAAARATDRAHELEARVDADGLLIDGSQGQPVLHPAIGEARLQRALVVATLARVEIQPPAAKTGRLSGAQRDQLADARRARWPRGAAG